MGGNNYIWHATSPVAENLALVSKKKLALVSPSELFLNRNACRSRNTIVISSFQLLY